MIATSSRPGRIAALTGLVAVLAATTGTAAAAAARPAVVRPAAARPDAQAAISGHEIAAATLAAHRPAAGATQQVELALTPRDRSGLASLAAAHDLTRSARLARLDAVLPGRARSEQVGAVLHRQGLTVTGSTALTVTASGPASTIASLFGTEQAAGLPTAQALPRVPTALGGLVTAAYGGDDTRPAELPLAAAVATPSRAALTVAQTRSLYGTTATTTTPGPGAPIVATLQFTTPDVVAQAIDDDDTYAADNHLYATSGYEPSTANVTQESVPANTCTQGAEDGDGVEVSLDTEALLTVAPQLRQRVYQSDNCGDAQNDAIAQIVDDVQDGAPIVALSTSWGECEEYAYQGESSPATADSDAVDSLLAAGVTMFAASGDSGSNDCGDSTPSDTVDTPAAIPGVVAVGGTTDTSGSALTVWDDSADAASGGGFSCGYFARPSYQSAAAKAASYPRDLEYGCPTGKSERMVPDIAENGGNGIDAYVHYGGCPNGVSCTTPVYGTSFAAPLAAGGFAQTLVNDGRTTGLGDIHALLYGSPGMTDVVSGNNGDYAATKGYDLASGLGSPSWPSVLGPRVGTSIHFVDPTMGPTVSVGYAGSASLGLRSITMTVTDQSGTQVSSYTGTTGGHTTFAATPGSTYYETVTVVDDAGNAAGHTTYVVAPLDEHGYVRFYGSGWKLESNSLNWGHTDTETVTAHDEAKIIVSAKTLSVLMRTGPDFGVARFYVDGKQVKVFDGYAPTYAYRVVVPLATFSGTGTHVLQMFVDGAHDTHSTNKIVRIDAVLAQQ